MAKTSLKQLFGPATSAPEVGTTSHQRPAGGGAATGGVAHKPESKAVTDTVITMQNLMNQLGTELSKDVVAQAAAAKLGKPNAVKDIIEKAKAFGATGVGHSGGADGDWGRNTRNALLAIKRFVAEMGIQKVNINEGAGTSPRQTMNEKDLSEAANANIHNLSRVFDAVDIIPSVSSPGSDAMEVLDRIDPTLPADSVNDPFGKGWGSLAVTKRDLSDFMSFLNFVQRLRLPGCITIGELSAPKKASEEYDLASLAWEILDRSIFRLAQEAAPAVTAAPAPQRAAGPCVNMIDRAISWFYDRADAVARIMTSAADEALPNPRPDRAKGGTTPPVTSRHDSDLARYYFAQMQGLSNDWDEIRGKIVDYLKAHGQPEDPAAVTRRVVSEAISGRRNDEPGHTHQRGDEGGGSTGRTIKGHGYGDAGLPIAEFMSMKRFPADITEKVSALTLDGKLPDLDFNQWQSYNWTSLAAWVKGATPPEQYNEFGNWAEAIKNALKEHFSEWRDQKDRPDDIVKDQWELLSQWITVIDNKITRWGREYRDKIAAWQKRFSQPVGR